MRDEKTIEKVTAALRIRFTREPDPVQPSATWRRELDARLAKISTEMEDAGSFTRYEKQIWRAGWISFAASMAALLLFSLLNVYSLKQSAVDRAIIRLYGNIIVENEW